MAASLAKAQIKALPVEGYEATRERAKNPPKPRWREVCETFHDYVLFMGNTGLRPDEASRLELRDVKIVNDESTGERILEMACDQDGRILAVLPEGMPLHVYNLQEGRLMFDAPGTAEDGLFLRDDEGKPLVWDQNALSAKRMEKGVAPALHWSGSVPLSLEGRGARGEGDDGATNPAIRNATGPLSPTLPHVGGGRKCAP